MSELRTTLERGAPVIINGNETDKKLDNYVERAVRASLLAHRALYEAFRDGDPRAVIFDDVHEKENGKAKFISLSDRQKRPSYERWEPDHAATDIGIRGINPDFKGTASTVTIVHANKKAEAFFAERRAPKEVMDAVIAVGDLDNYAVEEIAKPFLAEVAEAYSLSPEEYIRIFYPGDNDWQRTVTRVIMYHSDIKPSQRPTGSDGKVLGGKEHFDQSAWTLKLRESAPGFEWLDKTKSPPVWTPLEEAETACFRSAAEAHLPIDVLPCGHRATYDKTVESEISTEMKDSQVSRLAAVTFATSSLKSAAAVRPSSDETHRVS